MVFLLGLAGLKGVWRAVAATARGGEEGGGGGGQAHEDQFCVIIAEMSAVSRVHRLVHKHACMHAREHPPVGI